MADSAPVPTVAADPAAGVRRRLQRLLARVQAHSNLDVAFVSESVDELSVIYYPDSEVPEDTVDPGLRDRRCDSDYHDVALAELSHLLPDPQRSPLTASPTVTEELGIDRHVSVPIVGRDGTLYGTLCACARHGEETLNDTQLASVRLMAEVVADYLEEVEADRRDLESRRERLRTAAGRGGLRMQLQPVVRLATGELAGAEALARFPQLGQGPAEVFDEAWQVGVGAELEMAAVHAATDLLELIPEGAFLAVNVAPATLTGAAFAARAAELPPGRLVAEVTEHAVLDVEQVDVAAELLGICGVRCAVDDVGTGFSGLDRILCLGPDILKIDKSLVRGLDACPARHALISALVSFTRCTDITTVAEGIETAGELAALRALGVDCGQGYHLAPPCEPGRFGVGRPVIY